MKSGNLFFIILSILILCSCHFGGGKKVTNENDEEKISILRYDKVQSEYINSNSFSALQKMNMEYRTPTKILIEEVLELGQVNDDTITQKLKNYYSDSTLIQLIEDVEGYFIDLTELETTLTLAFRNLKKELPWIRVPNIYTQISAFNESVIVSDTLLGISLDKYMGEDYPFYNRFYHKYQRRTMREGRIPVDCIISFLVSLSPPEFDNNSTLLDIMIQMGKIYYIAQQALEYESTGLFLGYSEEEIEWCKENERNIWKSLVSKKELLSKNFNVICNYMEPSQYTRILDHSAPPLLGIWIGVHIIDAYMKQKPDTSMTSLLLDKNSLSILDESDYLQETD